MLNMNTTKITLSILALTAFLTAPFLGVAQDNKEKPKPYPLDTCLVSGEKLGGMGDPYVFTHEGREIKMCCKSCLKDFNKDTAKYIKKLEDAEKKGSKPAAPGHEGHNH
jgi:hypothetical protein